MGVTLCNINIGRVVFSRRVVAIIYIVHIDFQVGEACF